MSPKPSPKKLEEGIDEALEKSAFFTKPGQKKPAKKRAAEREQEWEKYGQTWGVRISAELKEQVLSEAARFGLTQKAFVEWLMRTALNAVKKGQLKPPLKPRSQLHDIAEYPKIEGED